MKEGMTLKKAIEILNDLSCWHEVRPYPDVEDSIKLGIEALKRIYLQREHPKRKLPTLLSGEDA